MKFKSLLQFVLVALIGQFLVSCSSTEYYRFAPAKAETYQKTIVKSEPVKATQESTPSLSDEKVITESEGRTPVSKPEPVLEASTRAAKPVLFETRKAVAEVNAPNVVAPVLTGKEAAALKEVKSRLATMTKAEKKEFKKDVKTALRDTNGAGDVVEIILAILLPPLAVFLHEGEIGSRFWISVLLTILFILPGIIYALLIVTDTI